MGLMTTNALNSIRDETYRMLDVVAHYTKDCEVLEAVLPNYLTMEKYKTYWHLNVKGGQVPGIFIAHNLPVDGTLRDLEPLLARLIELGWTADKTEDFLDGYGKSYPFRKKITIGGKPLDLYLTMRVFPHPNSQTCKKVQVGMEPKYELQCSG